MQSLIAVKRLMGCELDDFRERLLMIYREIRKDFTVDDDVFLVECVNELGIRHTLCARGGVDPHDPQSAESAFLRSPVAVGVLHPFINVMLRYREHF
jgi:hypothetical protein